MTLPDPNSPAEVAARREIAAFQEANGMAGSIDDVPSNSSFSMNGKPISAVEFLVILKSKKPGTN